MTPTHRTTTITATAPMRTAGVSSPVSGSAARAAVSLPPKRAEASPSVSSGVVSKNSGSPPSVSPSSRRFVAVSAVADARAASSAGPSLT